VSGITRDKEYDLTKGADKSKVNYFSVNPNGEAELITLVLSANCSARNKVFDFYFEELDIKGRSVLGNQVTKYPIKTIRLKEAGRSTLSARKLWFDNVVGRLNTDERGQYLGSFDSEDRLLVFFNDGSYEIRETELTQRFDAEQILSLEKFSPLKLVTAIYLDNEKGQYNVKRFKIETTTLNNRFQFMREGEGNSLVAVTTVEKPIVSVTSGRGTQARTVKVKLYDFVEVMGWKAVGTRLAEFSKSTSFEWVHKPQDPQQELF
jgi:topoisomerase-4 subunit A